MAVLSKALADFVNGHGGAATIGIHEFARRDWGPVKSDMSLYDTRGQPDLAHKMTPPK